MPETVTGDAALLTLRERAQRELETNILPFWQSHAFDEAGWLTGAVLNDLSEDDDRPRHAVIAARTLWTFAAAAMAIPARAPGYLATGELALDLLRSRFWDGEHGGVFWSLAPNRTVASDRKQIYAQAFTIYGLAQWHAATGDDAARYAALGLFDLLEAHARDRDGGGYLEARSCDWGPLADTALSDKDLSVPKSMNTNLHVLEAYTTLLRVTGDKRVCEALEELLRVTLDRIVQHEPWAHCALFFDMEWRSQVDTISYGHDIEASWLIWDAWEALAAAGSSDAGLGSDARSAALSLADAVREHALDADGGVLYEGDPTGPVNVHKHWWPQAEGVVGWLNAYQLAGRDADRESALAVWDFIDAHVVDHTHGEWFAELERDGTVIHTGQDAVKIGPWKCPYHNGRACLELMRRIPA
jgi:mannobiose 2-epimerase